VSADPENPAERWNRRYQERKSFDCRHPRDLVVEGAALLPPGEALDLACGRGRNAIYLAERGWRVTAVDVSQVALDEIAATEHAIRTICADLEAGGFKIAAQSCDLIVDTFYLQRDLFPAVRTGLRKGGIFIAEIPMEEVDASPMNPRYLAKPGELLEFFQDWKIERYEETRTAEHDRKTARLIAQKQNEST